MQSKAVRQQLHTLKVLDFMIEEMRFESEQPTSEPQTGVPVPSALNLRLQLPGSQSALKGASVRPVDGKFQLQQQQQPVASRQPMRIPSYNGQVSPNRRSLSLSPSKTDKAGSRFSPSPSKKAASALSHGSHHSDAAASRN